MLIGHKPKLFSDYKTMMKCSLELTLAHPRPSSIPQPARTARCGHLDTLYQHHVDDSTDLWNSMSPLSTKTSLQTSQAVLGFCSYTHTHKKGLGITQLQPCLKMMFIFQWELSSKPQPQCYKISPKGLCLCPVSQDWDAQLEAGVRGGFGPMSKRLSCPPPLLVSNTEPHPGLSQ